MKNWVKVVITWSAALVWLFVVYAVFGFRFETNDDAAIANIAAGAFGKDSQYLIHVNIVIGWILRLLNLLVPGLAWYSLLNYFLLTLAFSAVGFVFQEKFRAVPGCAVYLLLLVTAGTDLFCRFQYTKNAAFLIASGLLLVIRRLGETKTSYWLGTALCLFGSMLRFDLLLPVMAVSFFAFLSAFTRLSRGLRAKAAGSFLLIAAIGFSVFGINRFAYKLDPEWDNFYLFNEAREGLFDYRLQNMGPAHEYYDLGVREAEAALLSSWDIFDPDFFTAEKLDELSAAIGRNNVVDSMLNFPAALISLFFSNVYAVFAIFALALVLLSDSKQAKVTALLIFVVLTAGLFALFWLGRMIERVQVSLTLAAALFALSAIEVRGRKGINTLHMLVGAALAVSLLFLIPLKERNDYYLGTRLPTAGDFDAIRDDNEHLYLLSTEHFDKAMGYDVFSPRPPGYFDNIAFIGGWLINSPFELSTLRQYGVTNPFRDVVNSDTLLLLDSTVKHEINRYINVRYDVHARLEEYSDGIYRIVSEG